MKKIALLSCLAGLIGLGEAMAQSFPVQMNGLNTGGMTFVQVTCGASSTGLGVAGASYLTVQVPSTASQLVYFNWGGTVALPVTAVANASNQSYGAGSKIDWPGGGTGACIVASGTQVVTVGYK